MLRPPDTPARALILGLAVGLASLAILVLALVFWDDVIPDAEAEAQADGQDRTAEITAAKSAVVARAAEAQEINWGQIRVNGDGESAAVCGQVAIDAPDDSIQGPERFVFVAGQLTLESLDGTAAVEATWKDVCEG